MVLEAKSGQTTAHVLSIHLNWREGERGGGGGEQMQSLVNHPVRLGRPPGERCKRQRRYRLNVGFLQLNPMLSDCSQPGRWWNTSAALMNTGIDVQCALLENLHQWHPQTGAQAVSSSKMASKGMDGRA